MTVTQGRSVPKADGRRAAVSLRIERAAMELFAARPMSEVTVDEVAGLAGVALRTLYRYFPTKEEIFAAYPRREAARLGARITERPASEAPFTAVRQVFLEQDGAASLDELRQWLTAVTNAHTRDRIARVALVAMATTLSEALAHRVGGQPDDLWPSMAGTMIAGAIDVGARQWMVHGGDLVELQVQALDIAGAGLDRAR